MLFEGGLEAWTHCGGGVERSMDASRRANPLRRAYWKLEARAIRPRKGRGAQGREDTEFTVQHGPGSSSDLA